VTDVVITGLGAVTRFGRGAEALWRGVLRGEAIRAGQGELVDYAPPANLDVATANRLARGNLIAVDAAIQAVEDARLPINEQGAPLIGVVFTDVATDVARTLGVGGPVITLTGPSSGAIAIAEAAEMIRRGEAPVVIAGGMDLAGKDDRAQTQAMARPFDPSRDGVVAAEASAALVLEDAELARSRGARVYGEVAGHGIAFGGAPRPDYRAIARAMQSALLRAETIQGAVDWLGAAAAGDRDLDSAEALALRELWGPNVERLTVSSIHGASGYAPVAGGALGAVVALRAIAEGLIPPTAGFETPDPLLPDLDIVRGEARRFQLRTVVVNATSAATSVALVLGRAS
jgi:3-oxoacyl-(acyl-carrier-protein) synthase